MGLPATGIYEIDANGTVTVSLPPIHIAPNASIRAHTMLVEVSEHSAPASAEVYVSQYVQNGTVHGGKAYVLFGTDITEIVLTASVANGTVKGIMVIEYF